MGEMSRSLQTVRLQIKQGGKQFFKLCGASRVDLFYAVWPDYTIGKKSYAKPASKLSQLNPLKFKAEKCRFIGPKTCPK